MIYKSTYNRKDYCPPILGNGDISFAVDAEGSTSGSNNENVRLAPSAHIFRAGRRTVINVSKNQKANLFTFGSIKFRYGSELDHFEQELVLPDGYLRSVCKYGDEEVITQCFVHQDHPLFAIEKQFDCDDKEVEFEFTYVSENKLKNALSNCDISTIKNGAVLSFLACGQEDYKGELRIFLDRDCKVSVSDTAVILRTKVSRKDKLALYICLEDDLFCDNPEEANDKLYDKVKELGFCELLAENIDLWKQYFSVGYVRTNDEKLNSVYMTALYHLKCYTTRWSIPVGLYDNCWEARFFAFDEYYSYLGLLGIGHTDLAKRVPTFRLKICLQRAISRATSVGAKDKQARFMWETLENGTEGAPFGHWYDHVFHMCVIALGAYEYYEYTKDIKFLSECYEMIRACAKFFTLNMIYYTDSGKPYIGKCTDLERLGDSIERAFMTTCGAVKLLKICADASEILGIDDEYRKECRKLLPGLWASLPQNRERYLPYPDAKCRSIGVFSCKFPFDILASDDEKMLRAFEDFEEHENIYGNMYSIGSGVSAWYSCWKAEAYARCGKAPEAMAALRQSFISVGAFDEFFEINENNVRVHPWFTTASGFFLSTLNNMLIRSDGKRIDLLPAYEEQSISFKLLAKGGVTVEASIKDGEIQNVKLSSASSSDLPEVYFKGKRVNVPIQ